MLLFPQPNATNHAKTTAIVLPRTLVNVQKVSQEHIVKKISTSAKRISHVTKFVIIRSEVTIVSVKKILFCKMMDNRVDQRVSTGTTVQQILILRKYSACKICFFTHYDFLNFLPFNMRSNNQSSIESCQIFSKLRLLVCVWQ